MDDADSSDAAQKDLIFNFRLNSSLILKLNIFMIKDITCFHILGRRLCLFILFSLIFLFVSLLILLLFN